MESRRNELFQLNLYRWILVLLLSFSVVTVTGCSGCRDDKTAEEKKREEEEKKEQEKPTFESPAAVIYPGSYENVVRRNRAKRGHWATTDFQIISNKSDATGELTATSFSATAPIPVENTSYYSVSSRPFSIAKGEQRNLATNLYVPRRDRSTSVNINYSMQRSSGGLSMFTALHGVPEMRPFQYHIVVLTNRADEYGYFRVIDSVKMPDGDAGGILPFYNVVTTQPADWPISLPRQALYWTTIAYVVWDNLEVDQLDEEQRQAMLDWIHFGGQLIISGPDALDKLSNSFLADYLPAKFKQSRNLTATDLEALNENWSLPMAKQPTVKRKITLTEKTKLLGIELEPTPEAEFVKGTGEIAVERQVGRGRIVATAFSLRSKPIVRWPGYKSFFNGCLLRRPARRFGPTMDGMMSFSWEDDDTSIFDPLLGSTLRYISRDLGLEGTRDDPEMNTREITGFDVRMDQDERVLNLYPRHKVTSDSRGKEDHWHYGGFQHDPQSGAAGWNDESAISDAARETLRKAAGISPPSSMFVLKMLSVYLLVLVPLNWLVFRLIGRVEWAWIAAPIIAIAGAYMVVRMASLDIGFVRSNSQVSTIELYADYPRAHVAQYSALYTSLSTGYDVDLDNPSAQSLPLGMLQASQQQRSNLPVTFRRTVNNRLEGLQVQSNSTALLHTEMMFDTEGVFSYDEQTGEVTNTTVLNLTDVAVVRRKLNRTLQFAWIGDLASGTTVTLNFEVCPQVSTAWNDAENMALSVEARKYWRDITGNDYEPDAEESEKIQLSQLEVYAGTATDWQKYLRLAAQRYPQLDPDSLLETQYEFDEFAEMVSEIRQSATITVNRLFTAVAGNLELAPGEVRLMGTTDQSIGNNKFKPESTQTRQQSLAVVHLKRPEMPLAKRDVNSVEDFSSRSNLDWLSEDERFGEFESEDYSEDAEASTDDQ